MKINKTRGLLRSRQGCGFHDNFYSPSIKTYVVTPQKNCLVAHIKSFNLLFQMISLPTQSLNLWFETVHFADEGAVMLRLPFNVDLQLALTLCDTHKSALQ